MQTKLTLRIDEKVIEKAKRISRKRGKSISKMVSDFIQNEDRKENESVEVYPPITKKLKGLIKEKEFKKDDYYNYLEEKHK
ncbi:MAG: DUF6364 family protein [Melioribacteraceae bacterium]|nr:DUF6364 family protein [Melioribacteraceae bacterium]WKZ70338.1 MAG: DUF6364 family protein [Melioribacteraceae bacterium]